MPPAQWAVVEFAAINNILGGIYVTVGSIVNGLQNAKLQLWQIQILFTFHLIFYLEKSLYKDFSK